MRCLALIAILSPSLVALVPLKFAKAQVDALNRAGDVVKPANAQHDYQTKDLVLIELDTSEDVPQLVVVADEYKKVKKNVKTTRIVQEQRTRMVPVIKEDGKQENVEQTYTVSIPVISDQEVESIESAGKKPQKIPISKARLFQLDGKEIPAEKIEDALKDIKSVFLIRGDHEKVAPASKAIQLAMGDRAAILTTSFLLSPNDVPAQRPQAVAAPAAQLRAVPAQRIGRAIPAANIAKFNLPAALPRNFRGISNRYLFAEENLVLAKLDASGEIPKIICMVDSYRTEEREAMLTKFRTEKRTRTVTVIKEGKPVEQEQKYTVNVPYREKGMTKTRVPAGKKPASADWSECKLYKLDGSEVSLEEAKKILGQARPVFLVRGKDFGMQKPASELLQRIVSKETLVLATDASALLAR